jgi:hypothetical protein
VNPSFVDMSDLLALRSSGSVRPLAGRAVAIGRLPDCDVILEGDEVSRRHARVVPTPEGPLLVDRSRFGTLLNGEQVVAPTLLRLGDVVRIGRYELIVEPWQGGAPNVVAGWRERFVAWRRRYGLSELAGTAAAVAAVLGFLQLGWHPLLAALVGTVADGLAFYGVLALRETSEARESSRRLSQPKASPVREVLRDLGREFGAVEAIDALLIRPLCLYVGLLWLGDWLGVLTGKLVADLAFYGPVLALFHWRLATVRRPPLDAPHRRPTTAVNLRSLPTRLDE